MSETALLYSASEEKEAQARSESDVDTHPRQLFNECFDSPIQCIRRIMTHGRCRNDGDTILGCFIECAAGICIILWIYVGLLICVAIAAIVVVFIPVILAFVGPFVLFDDDSDIVAGFRFYVKFSKAVFRIVYYVLLALCGALIAEVSSNNML